MLDNSRQDIDNLFSDVLHDYQEDAPLYSWSNINDSLNYVKKSKRLSFLRTIAVFAAMLVTFSLGYLSSDYDLYKKSEAFYLKAISKKQNDVYRQYNQDTNLLVNKIDIKILNKTVDNLENSDAILPIDEINEENNIVENNKVNIESAEKERNIVKKVTDKNIPNQLLIKTLLWEEESRYVNGSFLDKNHQDFLSNWSFGAKFSPVYRVNGTSLSTLARAENFNSNMGSDEISSSSSELLSAYSGGVNVNYRLSKRFSIESGIFYSTSKQLSKIEGRLGLAVDKTKRRQNKDLNNLRTSANRVLPVTKLNYIQDLDYLELPLLIKYKIIDRKFGLDLSGGMSTNFLIRNDISRNIEDLYLSSEVNSTLYKANLSLGLNYLLLDHVRFNLEPTVGYSINPSSNNSLLNQYPYSFAVFAGFIYNLNYKK